MTSYQHSGRETYGQDEYPRYNVLIHLWGRWELGRHQKETAKALPVRGTTWTIPAVDEEHVTVEELQHVVRGLEREGIEWAWIDVACINQQDEALKRDEVGRQADIFSRALTAFIWLSRVPMDRLKGSLAAVEAQVCI